MQKMNSQHSLLANFNGKLTLVRKKIFHRVIFKKILTKILHKAKGHHTDADPGFFVVGQSLKGKHQQCLKRAR